MRQATNRLNFESYAERIGTLREHDGERNKKQIVQKWLQVANTEMRMASVNKAQFASLDNKRYHFMDGIVSLPYGHPLLSKIRQVKKAYRKIHIVIEEEKSNLLKLENEAVAKHERLRILTLIYAHPITYYKLNSNLKVNQKGSFDFTTTHDYILNLKWLLNAHFNNNNILNYHVHRVKSSKCIRR